MERNNKKCLLLQENIDEGTCFDIHMVVEGLAPEWTAPKRAVQVKDFKEKCRNCPYHRED